MILLLNTSTPTCYLYFAEASEITYEKTWESGRGLAKRLVRPHTGAAGGAEPDPQRDRCDAPDRSGAR